MSANIYTISSRASFVDALAEGVIKKFGADPLLLSSVTILLPNRRSARTLTEAFLRQNSGKALLLPKIRAIGDADEQETEIAGSSEVDIPPPIHPLKRKFLLAKLIESWAKRHMDGTSIPADQALHLAGQLAGFLDEVQREQLSLDELPNLVLESDLAAHWQITVDFLDIITAEWPKLLKEYGEIDREAHRIKLLANQSRIWHEISPQNPIIAAGTTGSIPATAELLKTIASLENGYIVLPGLDIEMPENIWRELEEHHPQYGMKHLLEHMEIPRSAVKNWQHTQREIIQAREELLSYVMYPSSAIGDWQNVAIKADALNGLQVIAAPNLADEAGVISLILRSQLEEKEKTAALVTNDRKLARMVASLLQRWGIIIDDSAGSPLSGNPVISFLSLIIEAVDSHFAPVQLLSLLKHPFACAGISKREFSSKTRDLEKAVLRGVRLEDGLNSIINILEKKKKTELYSWVSSLREALTPMIEIFAEKAEHPADKFNFEEVLAAHIATAEKLAGNAENKGEEILWHGERGEAAADFLREIVANADFYGDLDINYYPAIFAELLNGEVVRPRFGTHPRLKILSPIEARLQHYDAIILGGLNEGSWPASVQNAWMSRPMRERFGLPSESRRLGLAAHDFVNLCMAREVFITRAEKVDGSPTVPSMWLLRLYAVLKGAGLAHLLAAEKPWEEWLQSLYMPEKIDMLSPPAPRPPLASRPRLLWVTQIEKLLRDPYSVYAKHILSLKALDDIDEDPGAAHFGNIIHDALEKFVNNYEKGKGDALAMLLDCGREAFAELGERPAINAIWWPRFEQIAGWFVQKENSRREQMTDIYAEITGELTFPSINGEFTIKAKADRIEQDKEGGVTIIDYKTGTPPDTTIGSNNYSPQLALEAMIAEKNGFSIKSPVKEIISLEYWKISASGFEDKNVPWEAKITKESLEELINKFDEEITPYLSRPDSKKAPRFSDYDHLARVREWSFS